MKVKLHNEKTKITSLSNGVDFIGFRNFYYFKLLRKRNTRNILIKIRKYKIGKLTKKKILEVFQGWNAYAKWADSLEVRRNAVRSIYKNL